jgi:hypothetical protein
MVMSSTAHLLLRLLSGVVVLVLQGCEPDRVVPDTVSDRGVMLNTDAVWHIACPVMAGLYTSGRLIPNWEGQVSAKEVRDGLQEIGCSAQIATFQAQGIASYAETDVHQNHRLSTPKDLVKNLFVNTRFANLFTMQPADSCFSNPENIENGVTKMGGWPCNANPQNQQHGYSTTMRDMRFDKIDPDGKERFKFWIEDELVVAPEGVDTNEPVLLLDGLGRILAKARTSTNETEMFKGDLSGEYALARDGNWEGSNLQMYHAEIKHEGAKTALPVWQPLLAWSAWWASFSRPYGERKPNDIAYFTKTDLEDFFLRGKFPDEWRKRSWGFREVYATTMSMQGMNVADRDVYLEIIEALIINPSTDSAFLNPERILPTESRYLIHVAKFFASYIGTDLTIGNCHHEYFP